LGTFGHTVFHQSVKQFIIKRLAARKSWRLEYRLNGTRCRLCFKTKELAVAEQERIEGQVKDGGTAWLALSANARIELMNILREIQNNGKTLRAVWDEYKRRSGDHGRARPGWNGRLRHHIQFPMQTNHCALCV